MSQRYHILPRNPRHTRYLMNKSSFEVSEGIVSVSAPTAQRQKQLSLHAIAVKAIQFRLENLLKNEEGTRAGNDIEALHDMRVASRRLREALRIYAEIFPAKKLKQAIQGTRRVTRALGLVREVDVNLEQLGSLRQRPTKSSAIGLEYVIAHELTRQRRLRRRMLKKLDRLDLTEMQNDIFKLLERSRQKGFSESMPPTVRPESISFIGFVRRHIDADLDSVRTDLHRVSAHPTLRNFHQLRIRIKKFRYSIELLSRALESHRTCRILKHLKALQDELGRLHDRHVLHSRVRDLRCILRANGLEHLEKCLLRLMRLLARDLTTQKKTVELYLAQLGRRKFFEKIPQALKEERPALTAIVKT